MTGRKRYGHGQVLRGWEAREHLHMHRKDSHKDTPIMNVPEGFHLQQLDAVHTPQAAVSVVYVTLPQTFTGPVYYSTLTSNPNDVPTAAAHTSHAANNQKTSEAAKSSSAALPTSQVTPISSSASPMTTFATASVSAAGGLDQFASSSSSIPTIVAGVPLQATHSAVSTADNQTSSGMTGGARAGLAFGIIAGIAVVAGLVYFCMRRKRAIPKGDEAINEKHGSFADTGARQVEAGAKRGSSITEKVPASLRSSRTASTAPRLSLRPLTQFLPNLNEDRPSTGNNGFSEKSASAWERQAARQNPFDDERQGRSNSPPTNPFDEPEGKRSIDSRNMAPNSNMANGGKPIWESADASNSRTGPAAPVKDLSPPRGPNNVHRVQLDFKPSMDDELELRSGQLVRMLHEYDDGWALCIRMDRSQQGVTPRTCLSKLPVKPRPQGPPPGPRPGQGQGSRRPSNPPTPMNGQMGGPMQPRPLTPNSSSTSSSPTESHEEMARSTSVTVPQRKPVPGQAM